MYPLILKSALGRPYPW